VLNKAANFDTRDERHKNVNKNNIIGLNGGPASESVCVMQREVASTVQTIPHQLTVPPLPVPFSAQPYTPGHSLRCAEYSNTVRAGITIQQNE